MQWQRIEKAEFGYAVQVPQGWTERPANLKNSPWETARFGDPADRRHSVIVFRAMPRPGAMTVLQAAEGARTALTASGFVDFAISEAPFAGQDGARLDCAKHDAGRTWAVREYFVAHGEARLVLGFGSIALDEDEALFAAMAERFELLDPA